MHSLSEMRSNFISVFEAPSCIECFTDCIEVHFSIVALDNAIWSSNVSGTSKGARVPVA